MSRPMHALLVLAALSPALASAESLFVRCDTKVAAPDGSSVGKSFQIPLWNGGAGHIEKDESQKILTSVLVKNYRIRRIGLTETGTGRYIRETPAAFKAGATLDAVKGKVTTECELVGRADGWVDVDVDQPLFDVEFRDPVSDIVQTVTVISPIIASYAPMESGDLDGPGYPSSSRCQEALEGQTVEKGETIACLQTPYSPVFRIPSPVAGKIIRSYIQPKDSK